MPVAELSGLRSASELAVAGDRAYVCDRDGPIRIFDVSDPVEAIEIGSFDFACRSLALSGHHLYAASFGGGARVIDVSDPTRPTLVSRFAEGEQTDAIQVSDDIAYLGRWESAVGQTGWSIWIYDVTDPVVPSRIAEVPIGHSLSRLAAEGPLLVSCANRMQIFDVSDPGAPVERFASPYPETCRDARLRGDRLYVVSEDDGFRVLDVSDPAAPVEQGRRPGGAQRLVLRGDRAFLLNHFPRGLVAVDISDDANPVELGALGLAGHELAVASHAYVSVPNGGVRVIELADLRGPVELGFVRTFTNDADQVLKRGDRVYSLWVSLEIVDVSDPTAPRVLGRRGAGSGTEGFDLDGSLAAVASRDRLCFLDVANEALPDQLGCLPLSGWGTGAAFHGSRVLVSTFDGLEVVDASNPSAPVGVTALDLSISAWAIDRVGDLAYVVGASQTRGGAPGLRILDVEDPDRPRVVGALDLPDVPVRVEVARGFAYLACYDFGLRVVDVRDPAAPVELGSLPVGRGWFDLAVDGRLVYLAGKQANSGLRLVNVSDPTQPLELARLFGIAGVASPSTPTSLDAERGLAFSSDYGGVRILDFRPLLSGGARLELERRGKGLVEAVIFGSETFDVTTVDPASLGLGDADQAPFPLHAPIRDVDRDGHLDLSARFQQHEVGLAGGTETCLSGETLGGRFFQVCATLSPQARP